MNKPSIPKGMRDFAPAEMARRNYIFATIREVFALYGFEQIETPAMENLTTLLGKYGDEGDKLLYKVLNSGDFLQGAALSSASAAATLTANKLASLISEKGLRYDLTVPFARYVVQHRDSLHLPFKRYQMQPVWRADRPQKGRYREFYQCDADVVGSPSLLNEIELLTLLDEVFSRFGIRVQIKINNRKILYGIAETIGATDKMLAITIAIDKLNKIGLEAVNDELRGGGLSEEQVAALQPLFHLAGSNTEKLATIAQLITLSAVGRKGIEETTTILDGVAHCSLRNELQLDLTLARGLNYYTGAIVEVVAKDVAIGSLSGGGRYDNLTGIFGMEGLSGVGISFGADRIYDVLNQLNLYPQEIAHSTHLLFVNFGDKEMAYCLPLARMARAAGISTEVYPDVAKMKKQMSYADAKHIPFVAIAGEDEMRHHTLTIKDMATGTQRCVAAHDIYDWFAAPHDPA